MVHVRLAVLLVPPPHLVATGDLAGTVEHHARSHGYGSLMITVSMARWKP